MRRHLVLFFTRGVSLRTWNMVGMLEREVALYRCLQDMGWEVSFVTYGHSSDLDFADKLNGIRVLCNEEALPLEAYETRLLEQHAATLRSCHVIKTNQAYGAPLAAVAAERYRKPLVARCGYLWSRNTAREFGAESPQYREALQAEESVFKAATRVVVTTEAMAEDVVRRIPEAASITVTIPNYVDTLTFCNETGDAQPNSIVFVGRISREKNVQALLDAIRPLPVTLTVIGEGPLRPGLQAVYGDLDGKVRWEGNVPNSTLPSYFNQTALFVLPSLYEGHPKALLEAMSCGMSAIGADSPGIREIISHGHNGYLCPPDFKGLRQAIEDLLADPVLRQTLGCNAREYVTERFSLARIAELEHRLLLEVVGR
jgi:glycosyltransferase involved in cell wall biosynthesis